MNIKFTLLVSSDDRVRLCRFCLKCHFSPYHNLQCVATNHDLTPRLVCLGPKGWWVRKLSKLTKYEGRQRDEDSDSCDLERKAPHKTAFPGCS
eukprot:3266951-Amphidinium_carterae.3